MASQDQLLLAVRVISDNLNELWTLLKDREQDLELQEEAHTLVLGMRTELLYLDDMFQRCGSRVLPTTPRLLTPRAATFPPIITLQSSLLLSWHRRRTMTQAAQQSAPDKNPAMKLKWSAESQSLWDV
jgi:hypothetical protein